MKLQINHALLASYEKKTKRYLLISKFGMMLLAIVFLHVALAIAHRLG